MSRQFPALCGSILLCAFAGCTQSPANVNAAQTAPPPQKQAQAAPETPAPTAVQTAATKPPVPISTFEVKHTFPHDPKAFTQGLIYANGFLYESTGLNGRSSLRREELETGKVLQKTDVPRQYFAEGMTLFQGKIFQITWQSHVGFFYDPKTFQKQGEFKYTGEGWGLTHDDKLLIMSDGTNVIRFLDPANFQVKRTMAVLNPMNGEPLKELNELEYVKGEIYANIWQTDIIARIDPQTGKVLGWIDLTGLLPLSARSGTVGSEKPDVLNGIAYDADKDRLFVTGKLWPYLYEITLKSQP